MRIAYNPITAAALTTAPANNDITFDLKGLNIFVRGVKFKGTDTTYSVFKKHTSSSGGGYNGLVPVPSYTSTNTRFLREDGTWLNITMSLYYYTLLTDENLNDYKTEGRWYYMGGSNTVTNGPSGINGGGELYVGRNASGYRYLKIILASGYIWFRIWNNKTWGSWTRWYTDANTDSKVLLSSTTTANFRPVILGYNNDTSTSGLSASVTNKVYTTTTIYALPSTGSLWANKLYSGGKQVITEHQSLSNYVTKNTNQTITGAKIFSTLLTANRIKITNTEAVKHIEFSRGNLNYITAPTSGSIAFVVEGQALGSATSDLIISNNKLYPGTTNVTYLGQSSLRWSNVYSVLGNFSGTVTSNGFNKSGSSNSYVLLGGGGHKALSDFALSTSLNNYVTKDTALTITGVKTFSTLLKFTVALGTAPFTVTSSTVVTNLNADLLDGIDWASFNLERIYTINASSLDKTKFYPIFFGGQNTDNMLLEIKSPGGVGSAEYNTNRFRAIIHNNGWDDSGEALVMLSRFNYQDTEITIGAIGFGQENGGIAVWVRGGRKYYLRCNRIPSLKTSNYTYGTEIYTVGTNLYGGTNTKVTIKWQNNSDRAKYDVALVSSNVASATKLQTARTIWGLSFDGTKNISGNMSGVGRITFNSADIYLTDPSGYNILTRQSGNLYLQSNAGGSISIGYRGTSSIDFYGGVTEAYTAGTALGRWNTTGLGIGTTSPSYKLHVVGNAYASGLIKAESYIYSQNGWFQNNKTGTGLYNSANDARWYANSNGWYADKSATFAGYVTSTGFKKSSSSDSYVLLGGGGHKLLSELLTTYDGRYVGGNKQANHGANATSYTADTYSSTFVNKSYVAFAERGSWAYAKNGYVTTDFGNIHLAGTAIFQWGASDTNKTLLFITPLNASGVTSPLLGEMLYYSSNGDNYNKGWTRVVTNRNYTAIITKIGTATVGSTTKPIYLNAGTPTASNATVGTASRPIYMSGGNLVAGTYTFGNASGNAAINNGTVNTNLNADMLDGYNETSFFRHRGSLSISSSIPTSSELTTNNGLNGSWQISYPGASGHLVQFYCAGSTRYLLLYTTYNRDLLWRQSTDANLAKTWRTIIDTSNYTSYIVKIGTTTKGSATKGIYLNAGTPTEMTYSLAATVNSGATNKLAYYSSATAINDWTTNVGSSTLPIYIKAGTPTACSSTLGVNITGYSNYLTIHDIRNTSPTPNDFADKQIKAWFNNTGTPDSSWWSGITVKGWTDGYAAWQLAGYSSNTSLETNLYYRRGLGATWGSWRVVLDSSNYTSYVKKIGTTDVGTTNKPIYLNDGTPTALSATLGSAALPVYLSSGSIVACTASSVFSKLSNSGNNISITVAGLNRTLTVGYASASGYARKLYKIDSTSRNWTTAADIVGNGIVAYTDKTTSGRWTSYGSILLFSNTDNPDPGVNGHWITQIWSGTDNKLGVRWRTNTGAWTAMLTILTTGNYTSSLDGRYVNVTGDTMTGLLTINRSNLDPAIRLNLSGTAKGCYGWLSTMGVYMYSYEVGKYISIKSDGNAYFGTTSANYKIWHAGNDGSGSGLDADLLDGVHASTFMRATNANGYYGLTTPAGSSSDWIRTTVNGIIPYQSGGSTAGHGSLGTSSWYFKAAYIQNVYGTFNGTATNADKVDGYHAGNSSGQVAVSNGTVCSNLNADLLDGYHASKFYENGYTMFSYTIDASSLNVNTYYPVTFSIGSSPNVRIECRVALNSGTKPSWSTHKSGFSVRKIWETNGSGWGTNSVNRRILVSDYSFTNTDPVRGVGLLTNSSVEYVYVRGGGKYFFYVSHGCSPVLRTSTYTTNSQSVAPTTSAPAAITRNVAFITDKVSGASVADKLGTTTIGGTTTPIYLSSGSPVACSASTAATASTIAVRDSNGDILCRLVRSNFANLSTISGALAFRVNNSSDNYVRFCSNTSAIRTWLGVASSSHTHTYYWANVKVSTSSSTSTSPTFNTTYTSNWYRSTGQTGWYSETYGGGIYMTDTTYVRTYANKSFYVSNTGDYAMYTAGGFASARTNGAILSTYYNSTWYKDTILTHGNGNLSISPPGGNLYLAYNRGLAYFGGSTYYINRSGYFNGTVAVANKLGTTTKGSATKGIYLSSGIPTAMTYSLNATVNSGAANKLAYYSGTNSIDDYTTTVGSSEKPIYLDDGVPTACSYSFTGSTDNPVIIWCGEIYRLNSESTSWFYIKTGGCCSGYLVLGNSSSAGNLIFKISNSVAIAAFCSTVRLFTGRTNTISAGDGSVSGRSSGMGDYMTICTYSNSTSEIYIKKFKQLNENNDSWSNDDFKTLKSGNNKPLARFYLMVVGFKS